MGQQLARKREAESLFPADRHRRQSIGLVREPAFIFFQLSTGVCR
jgi:hypothetical protein